MQLNFAQFEKASKLLKQYLNPTPLIKNEWLSKKYDCNIFLKLENLQPVGSFKLRGATNMIANLSEEDKQKGVVAVSAGNHAQGVAWAANKFGIKATIIMPKPSPIVKVMNTEDLGAEVILAGENVDESFEFVKKYLEENDRTYVHPFCDENVIYGQGSLGFELSDQIDKVDFLFGSIGGGGLICGAGKVTKHFYPECKIVGAQATGAASMIKSLQKGKIFEVSKESLVHTFADGIKVKNPNPKMYDLLDEVVDEAVHVDDDQIAISVLDLMERGRIIVEGAGAVSLAAFDELFERNPRRFKSKNIVLILSGGNIDMNLIDRIIEKGMIESKRRLKMSVVLDDKPGALSQLTGLCSEVSANVLQVVHRRDIPDLDLHQSIVDITLEARDAEHASKIRKELEKLYRLV